MLAVESLVMQAPGKGGANEKVAGQLINDDQAAPPNPSTLACLNCHTDEIGSIVKRKGYSVYAGTYTGVTDITNLFQYKKFNGRTFEILIGDNGTTAKILDISTPASEVDITGNASLSVGTRYDSAVIADKLILTNDARDPAIVWDGSDTGFDRLFSVKTVGGTVTGVSGEFVLTGSDTNFQSSGLLSGDLVLIDGDEYEIDSVNSDTEIYIKDTFTSSFSASEFKAGSLAPKGKFVEEFENYGFIANTVDNPERVFWSALSDPESWTATDFKRLSGACTGMIKRDNALFIFTATSTLVCRATGDSITPFSFDLLDTNVGCISNRSLVNIEGVIYWLAKDGHIYRMASFQPERVTEAIPQTIASLNIGALSKAVAEDHAQLRQYWIAVPRLASTKNDFIIAIDYLNNEIFYYDGLEVKDLTNFTDSSGVTRTYFGDENGYVYLTNNGDADYPNNVETGIDFHRYTKMYNFSRPGIQKRIRGIEITANNAGNYTSSVELITDFDTHNGASTTISHDGGEELLGVDWMLATHALGKDENLDFTIDTCKQGKYLQFKFSNASANQPVKIRDYSIRFQTYAGRRK